MLWDSVKDTAEGFCHGDLHTANLIFAPPGDYTVLDFDLASHSFPAFDLMTLCDRTDYFNYDESRFDAVTRVLEALCDGYRQERPLSDGEIAAVYRFIGIRHYQLQAQILDVAGLDCIDEAFIDNQYDWLMRWHEQCERRL